MAAIAIVPGSAVLGQGLDNLWQGGYENFSPPPWGGSQMDFYSGVPLIALESRTIDIYHTAANISDSAGNLLFFTNGVVVGRQDGDTMQNGAGLNPSDYTNNWYPDGLLLYQANLIIPKPGQTDSYLLFHNTVDNLPSYTASFLYLSEINMALNGGQGEVVSKNAVIHTGGLQNGHLIAVKHGNGRDWWVYAHEYDSDVFLRWLIAPTGVFGPIAQSVGVFRPEDAGQVVFTQDGEKFAYFTGISGLDVFQVDRCSGEFTTIAHVEVTDGLYGIGVSFSPNGRFIYLSNGLDLFQVDSEAPDVQASLNLIATWDSTYSPGFPFATVFGASKLAPDGKIYVSTLNSTDKLHVINFPDSLCPACDVVQHGITLPTYWKNSLPNHPNYHLGALDGSVCDSLGLGVVDVPEELNMSLYPNPNAGTFSLSFAPQPEAGLLEVHDINGRLVHSEPVAPWSQLKRVQLPTLKAGVYQCRLRFGKVNASKRFVIE